MTFRQIVLISIFLAIGTVFYATDKGISFTQEKNKSTTIKKDLEPTWKTIIDTNKAMDKKFMPSDTIIQLSNTTDIINRDRMHNVYSDENYLYLDDSNYFQEDYIQVYDIKAKQIKYVIDKKSIPKTAKKDRFDFKWLSNTVYRLIDFDKNITIDLREGFFDIPLISSQEYIVAAIKNKIFIYDTNLTLLKILTSHSYNGFWYYGLNNGKVCYLDGYKDDKFIFKIYDIKHNITKSVTIAPKEETPYKPYIFFEGDNIVIEGNKKFIFYNLITKKIKTLKFNTKYIQTTQDEKIIAISKDNKAYILQDAKAIKIKENVSLLQKFQDKMLYISNGKIYLQVGQKDTKLHLSLDMHKFIYFGFTKNYALISQKDSLYAYDYNGNLKFVIDFEGVHKYIFRLQALNDDTVILLFRNGIIKLNLANKKIIKEVWL